MTTFLENTFLVVQFILLFFWSYWMIISFFGFGKAKKLKDKTPQKRFLLLVPAHNEEKVIGNLVENLLNLDYPKELYDVVVIADNCTDNTAKISRELGAGVIEHTSKPGELKGKPYGIKYALDVIGDDLTKKYDGVAFFDADNLATVNYLKEMNNHLLKGDRLIQCYLDSKNPNDNWVTLSYATSYYFMNRSWQLAKYRLGLGNAIGGTGFCVDTKLLQDVGWTARSLTEDLEFTMQCLLKGIPAKWSHHARVYDEKPEGFIPSCIQRLRWARGHWDVCFKYSLPLLVRSIKKLDIRAFDGVMYLLNPGKIVLATLTGIMLIISYFSESLGIQHVSMPIWLWFIFLAYNFIYVALSAAVDSAKRINKVKAIISLLIFNYSYVPLFIWAFLTSQNKTWVRTDHSKSVSLDDMH
ncbi:MAG: glycosyltransferase family 2 protein [Bacillus sp. (in: firmicutes)]